MTKIKKEGNTLFELIPYVKESGRCPMKDFLNDLKTYGIEIMTKYAAYEELLKMHGNHLNEVRKEATKHIGDKLYELRVDDIRVFFFYVIGNKIVLLHGFIKKTNKTPQTEIDRAKAEMKDYQRRYGL